MLHPAASPCFAPGEDVHFQLPGINDELILWNLMWILTRIETHAVDSSLLKFFHFFSIEKTITKYNENYEGIMLFFLIPHVASGWPS